MRSSGIGKQRAQARRRWLTVALVLGVGAVTAVSAAQIAAGPDDRGALDRAITQQKVEAGELAANDGHHGRDPKLEAIEHQAQGYTVEQMLQLVRTYEPEMRVALDRGENARILAYRSKDIIRMTCIEDKLLQMRTVLSIAEPRFLTIQSVTGDELVMRGQFSIIHQAWERILALANEIEICTGEALDTISYGKIGEATTLPGHEVDPARPQGPDLGVVDRPPEASTYR